MGVLEDQRRQRKQSQMDVCTHTGLLYKTEVLKWETQSFTKGSKPDGPFLWIKIFFFSPKAVHYTDVFDVIVQNERACS